MKPFAVLCTTCRARLKVLDRSAIGQILACPKCHSMVQVEPPPDWTPEEDTAADVGASGILGAAGAGAAGSAAATGSAAGAAGSKIGRSEAATVAPSASAPPIIGAAKPNIPAQPATAAVIRPAPIDGAIPGADPSRWFWPTFSGVVGVAIAAGALVIYWDRHRVVPTVAAATVSAAAHDVATNSPSTAPPVAHDPPSAKPVAPAAPTTDHAAIPKPATAPTLSQQQPPGPQLAPPKPIAVPPPLPPPAIAQVAPLPAAPVPSAVPPANPPAAANPAAANPPAAAPSADNVANNVPVPAEATDPAGLQVAAPVAPQAMPRPSLQRIAPRNVDVAARLADRVPAIEFQQTPLAQFLAELSEMSTVPISLDIDAIAAASVSPEMPVSVQLKDTTLAGILDAALAGHGLAWRTVGHEIQVGQASPQDLRRVRYSVADLAATPDSRRQFAATVHALIEPSGWSEADGSATSLWSDGALVVTADAAAHAELLVFCEKLRLARALPLRSRVAPERFHLDSRTAHAKAALDTPLTVNFSHPESLQRILKYLGSATHLNLLVDQVALAEDGISADSEGVLISQQQPLGQSLSMLLEPMELTYRVIDEHTFEITTPKAAGRHAEIEFYPTAELLPAGSDPHDLITRLIRESTAVDQAGAARDPSMPLPTIEFDAASKYLIVRAPQSIQRRIESLLGRWRLARD